MHPHTSQQRADVNQQIFFKRRFAAWIISGLASRGSPHIYYRPPYRTASPSRWWIYFAAVFHHPYLRGRVSWACSIHLFLDPRARNSPRETRLYPKRKLRRSIEHHASILLRVAQILLCSRTTLIMLYATLLRFRSYSYSNSCNTFG